MEARNEFSDISEEIIGHEIVPRLIKSDIKISSSLACSNSSFFNAFKQPLELAQAKLLFKFIVMDDVARYSAVIVTKPALMFVELKYKGSEGEECSISPLRYALSIYNNNCINLLVNAIESNEALIASFKQQVNTDIKYITIQPLMEAYRNYFGQHANWHRDQRNNRNPDREWWEVARCQQKILPLHLLKRFCSSDGRQYFSFGSQDLVDFVSVQRQEYESLLGDLNDYGSCEKVFIMENQGIMCSYQTSGRHLCQPIMAARKLRHRARASDDSINLRDLFVKNFFGTSKLISYVDDLSEKCRNKI